MKGGKKKNGDSLQEPPLLPPPADGGEVVPKTVHSGDDESSAAAAAEGTVMEEQRREEAEASGEESIEEEKRGKGFDQFEHLQIEQEEEEEGEEEEEEGEEPEPDRPKLAEGFYEIEAVRRKRVRKGEVQYLIKWRGWPETSNTWEPLDNLVSCSDVIDAFEESLLSGKRRYSRRRKRKYGGGTTHTQSKKKQQTSPAAATYNVPAVKVFNPLPMAPLDKLNLVNEGERYLGGINNVGMEKEAKENGFGMVFTQIEEIKEENELNLKLSELRGTMAVNEESVDKFAVRFKEVHALEDGYGNGLSKIDSVEHSQTGRCTGAKRRKSGSVKRFKQDSPSSLSNDAQNAMARTSNGPSGSFGGRGSQHSDFVGSELGHRNKFDTTSKNMTTITEIIKPISYSSSTINDVHDVSVTFMAMRSDGKEVTVDNKFLKANNPLLLINFYEQNLRYSPT